MSPVKLPLESDDSSQIRNQSVDGLSRACEGLRGCAFRATNKLSSARANTIAEISRGLLQDFTQCAGAVDMHLFRVTIDETGTGLVGVRYHSGNVCSDAELQPFERFQFRLLPPRVQECMTQDQIAKIRGASVNGGRVISSLLQLLNCDSYYLCPIFTDGRLRGILGVASRFAIDNGTAEGNEFFALLKLNGTILLNSILRVQRESKRRRKLREWRRIANQACDFAMTVDHRFVVCDTASFGAGNATPSLNGLRLIDIVARNFHRALLSQINTAVRNAEVRTIDFQISLGHEGPQWYLARIEPSRRSPEACVTLYLTNNNPDKVLEEEVRELTDQLVKASRLSLLGQMSTEFAHQLNQPLQAILNYCNIIQRRIARGTATDENNLTALANIEKSVVHSGEIIQRIRDFVKFRSLLTETLPLQELIDHAMMMVIPTARAWNADIVIPLNASELEVEVDKAQTTHVLVNLMINALEACRQFGVNRPRIELYVRTEADQRSVTIAVKDNGPGLPAADPEIVFRKFYSGKDDGLGMGLAISREVCESQGGSLSAANNTGENGCTFFVALVRAGESDNDTVEIESLPDEDLPID